MEQIGGDGSSSFTISPGGGGDEGSKRFGKLRGNYMWLKKPRGGSLG